MILADSTIWVDHIRRPELELFRLLTERQVLIHPMIIGELAVGNLPDRREFLLLLNGLTWCERAEHSDVFELIETAKLHGRGIGFVDAHLVAATRLTGHAKLWTRDRRLRAVAEELGIAAAGLA